MKQKGMFVLFVAVGLVGAMVIFSAMASGRAGIFLSDTEAGRVVGAYCWGRHCMFGGPHCDEDYLPCGEENEPCRTHCDNPLPIGSHCEWMPGSGSCQESSWDCGDYYEGVCDDQYNCQLTQSYECGSVPNCFF